MINFIQAVEEICVKDVRYKPEGYEFVSQALNFTRKKMKKDGHITGRELSEGMRDFAIDQYGPMAKSVLKHWGIHKTEDFGNIVFNLIEKKIFFKTENDSIDDFKAVYDFDSAFNNAMEKIFLRKNNKKSLQSST